jgi:predicted  nucleic acid-binding Zn ribbon protein
MITAKITFGKRRKQTKTHLENLAESYLSFLLKAGQICGQYLMVWTDGLLSAYVQIPGPSAIQLRYHSEMGRQNFDLIKQAFGREPLWNMLNDNPARRENRWRDASFIYLFAHAFYYGPPLHCGDNGRAIPTYLFPVTPEIQEELYFWQGSYRDHDRVWLDSRELEMFAYRELADPLSQLSKRGRRICQTIEEATGVPTFYFLLRYWGRDQIKEKGRLCPGCGHRWHRNVDGNKFQFWQFSFRCNRCRLVSHLADSDDNKRHARIGEYRKI